MIKIDGGVTNNKYLTQFQANISKNWEIRRSNNVNSTPLGAALASGLGAGYFKNLDEIKRIIPESVHIKPEYDLTDEHYQWKSFIKNNINETTRKL